MEKFGGIGNIQYLCTRNSEMSQSLMNMQRGVAQLGSASGLGPGGRRFESCHPDFCLTLQRKRDVKCGNSSVGRARPCQGRGREFESRLPLFDILNCLEEFLLNNAQVAELVDAHVSGACVSRRAGSSPVLGTF